MVFQDKEPVVIGWLVPAAACLPVCRGFNVFLHSVGAPGVVSSSCLPTATTKLVFAALVPLLPVFAIGMMTNPNNLAAAGAAHCVTPRHPSHQLWVWELYQLLSRGTTGIRSVSVKDARAQMPCTPSTGF